MTLQSAAQQQLRSYVERLERIEQERKAALEDFNDLLKEAAGVGFDKKIIRQVLKVRRKSKNEHEETQSILDTYLRALGYSPDAPGEMQPA